MNVLDAGQLKGTKRTASLPHDTQQQHTWIRAATP
jgi:hypothetical protein